jgi:metallophosphoesterase (TIGR00282 family)
MLLLAIGDIVGKPGKHACSQILPRLISERSIDFVIANAENAAAGSGLTPSMFNKLRHYGVDVCTMGDHIFRRREILPLLQTTDRVVRPANLPPEAVGPELAVAESRSGVKVAVFSLLGRTFMNVRADCPFHAADRLLETLDSSVKAVVVDMHAETTSEKVALGWYLDGRVSAVLGTHTHVQTADERILPSGTAYITDLGMTGPYDSVLADRTHSHPGRVHGDHGGRIGAGMRCRPARRPFRIAAAWAVIGPRTGCRSGRRVL